MTTRRFTYLTAVAATMLAGLGSRKFREELPEFFAEYAGDTLWALMLFFLVSALLAGQPILSRAAISACLTFLVEVSQLYHAPWIDALRQTTLGGLVLGSGFLWTDLTCYAFGTALGACFERGLRQLCQPN